MLAKPWAFDQGKGTVVQYVGIFYLRIRTIRGRCVWELHRPRSAREETAVPLPFWREVPSL